MDEKTRDMVKILHAFKDYNENSNYRDIIRSIGINTKKFYTYMTEMKLSRLFPNVDFRYNKQDILDAFKSFDFNSTIRYLEGYP